MAVPSYGPAKMGVNVGYTGDGVQILYNSDYAAKAITLNEALFEDGLMIPAGFLVTEDGMSAHATGEPFGVVLHDVYKNRPQATVVYRGAINAKVAAEHLSDVTDGGLLFDPNQTAKLKSIVFIGLDSNTTLPT